MRNVEGYDLHEISPTEWEFHVKGVRSFKGTLTEIGVLAVKLCQFEVDEIALAVKYMNEYNHDSAHFGMYGGFIHTFNKEKGNGQKAS